MVAVTGLGSLPGVDFPGAVGTTFDVVPVPYLPELPARGPEATMIARGAAVLAGLDAELTTSGWRLAPTPGPDLRRSRAMLRDDLDMMAETVGDYEGLLRVPVVGPWTLIASLHMQRGGAVLADSGARRDVGDSLREGTENLVEEIVRRMPRAVPRPQLDEPLLPSVLAGSVPTQGGLFRLAAIDQAEALGALARWGHGLPDRDVDLHCCAPGLPLLSVMRGTGLTGVAVDVGQLTTSDIDDLAGVMDLGGDVLLGVVADASTDVRAAVGRGWSVLRHLGVGPEASSRIWVTPACGLATWPVRAATTVFTTLRSVSSELDERLEG